MGSQQLAAVQHPGVASAITEPEGVARGIGETSFRRHHDPMLTLFLLAALAVIDRASTHVEQEDDLLSFSYAWPAEINDVPALRAIILAEAAAEQAQARRWAREGRAGRGSTFNGHSYAKGWEMRGSNSQLISLAAGRSSYTGGAHGNQNFSVLLWDRAAQRSVPPLILGADVVERLKPRYCAAPDLDGRNARRAGSSARRILHYCRICRAEDRSGRRGWQWGSPYRLYDRTYGAGPWGRRIYYRLLSLSRHWRHERALLRPSNQVPRRPWKAERMRAGIHCGSRPRYRPHSTARS